MSQTVLLVRPNDFIVDDMRALLLAAGFQPEAGTDAPAPVGAVVSTAVKAAGGASFLEALLAVRARHPGLRVAATTMIADAGRALTHVEFELGASAREFQLIAAARDLVIGVPNPILLLRRDDVAQRAPWLTLLLRQFFRRPGSD